jgi:hypothetical protein
MPNGIYPIPQFYFTADSPHTPSLRLRLKTWWRRDRLDEQHARGADRTASPELELRSNQLVGRVGRIELAESLESLVQHARYGPALGHIQVLRGAEISRCADDLLALAQRLRDPQPVAVRGAAMVSRLLSDGAGPLTQGNELPLRHAVRSARLALDPVEESNAAFPAAA